MQRNILVIFMVVQLTQIKQLINCDRSGRNAIRIPISKRTSHQILCVPM